MSKVEHTCPFCGSKAKRWPAAIAENPFCAGCLYERMAIAAAPRCPTCMKTMEPISSQHGHYVCVPCNNVVELRVLWKQLERLIDRAGVERVREIQHYLGAGDDIQRWKIVGKEDESFGVVELRFVDGHIELTVHDPFGPETH